MGNIVLLCIFDSGGMSREMTNADFGFYRIIAPCGNVSCRPVIGVDCPLIPGNQQRYTSDQRLGKRSGVVFLIRPETLGVPFLDDLAASDDNQRFRLAESQFVAHPVQPCPVQSEILRRCRFPRRFRLHRSRGSQQQEGGEKPTQKIRCRETTINR